MRKLIFFLCFTLMFAQYFEDFNNSNGGYVALPESGWIWLRDDTNGYWQTWERGNFSYRLISIPFIALQDTPIVSFVHWYETELYQTAVIANLKNIIIPFGQSFIQFLILVNLMTVSRQTNLLLANRFIVE